MASGEVFFIEGENSGRFPHCNAIFVDDELPAIIDPATREDYLLNLHREKRIRLVINSHYHIDHTRYNRLFRGSTFAAHRLDAPAIQSLDENAKYAGIYEKPWFPAWKKVVREVWRHEEVEIGRTLEDLEEICLGQNTMRIIHAPGHTPGHICVEFVERKAVYLADMDLTRFGPWYGNALSDIDSFLSSIERLKRVKAETWYTAHGEGVISGDITERLEVYGSIIHERDRRILEFLSKERTKDEIIERALIYGKKWDPPQMFAFFEWMMVSKHIQRLEKMGLVASKGDRYVSLESGTQT